ncbi:hypothetical protein K7432_003740 [Basidiobolus ranarum]|uniref:BZIP domain-containing protein n=1 Tax=Basidiobolus ranarum TaxID=34480 RepID=A0ABR2W5S5_9FUNG
MNQQSHFGTISSNQIPMFNSELCKNYFQPWSSTQSSLDANPISSGHSNVFPIMDPVNCTQMSSTMSENPTLLPIYQYFADSNPNLNPQSLPELTHSPPYSPQTTPTQVMLLTPQTTTISRVKRNAYINYAPILPNGVPHPDLTAVSSTTTSKRKRNPNREAVRVALMTAAESNPELTAKLENDEDKRRRNTAASARFRIKKKLREQALEQAAKDMSNRANLLEQKVKELEMEIKWLHTILVDKDPYFTDLEPPFRKQRFEEPVTSSLST